MGFVRTVLCPPLTISSFADFAFRWSSFTYEIGISGSSSDAISKIGMFRFWMLSSSGRDWRNFALFVIAAVSVVSSPSFWNSSGVLFSE